MVPPLGVVSPDVEPVLRPLLPGPGHGKQRRPERVEPREQPGHLRVAILGGGHGLDHVAGERGVALLAVDGSGLIRKAAPFAPDRPTLNATRDAAWNAAATSSRRPRRRRRVREPVRPEVRPEVPAAVRVRTAARTAGLAAAAAAGRDTQLALEVGHGEGAIGYSRLDLPLGDGITDANEHENNYHPCRKKNQCK